MEAALPRLLTAIVVDVLEIERVQVTGDVPGEFFHTTEIESAKLVPSSHGKMGPF